MKDLTEGSISRHLLTIALPTAAGMVCQSLFLLVDLYFVAQLGESALAGVSVAANVATAVFALTQMLGVGTIALVSQAAGRKDRAETSLLARQSILLSGVMAMLTLVGGYAFSGLYVRSIAADTASAAAAATYLYWLLPGLALQFPVMAMGSTLRGMGVVQPTMVMHAITVLLNAALCPMLISGWGTHRPLGVLGAGLAGTIATAAGLALLWTYFAKEEEYLVMQRKQFLPQIDCWKRIVTVGLPAGSELVVMFAFVAVIHWFIRQIGADAQAGFGVATRIMEGIFLPALAIAFAAGPVAGQNFGARNIARVKDTFRAAALMNAVVAAVVTLLCQWRAETLVRTFTHEAEVVDFGAFFLRMLSSAWIANGFATTCSSLFLALGNTWPSLISSGSRVVLFVMPGLWFFSRPWFELQDMHYLYVATAALQALISWVLLDQQFRKRFTQRAAA